MLGIVLTFFYFSETELELGRGRETNWFPVAELFKPRGLKAERLEGASSEIPVDRAETKAAGSERVGGFCVIVFSMNDQIKIAVNVFVLKDAKLLLGKRKNAAGEGEWGLPGGHLEYMEGLEEGAKRELKEETGLDASKLEFFQLVNDPRKDDAHYIHVNFLLKNPSNEPRIAEPEKCEEWRWFDLENLPENIFFGHKKSISAFLNKENFVD